MLSSKFLLLCICNYINYFVCMWIHSNVLFVELQKQTLQIAHQVI